MIIKPSRAGSGGPALARYLTEGKNERAEVLELRNLRKQPDFVRIVHGVFRRNY